MLSFNWISLLLMFLSYFSTIKTLKPRIPPLSLHHGKSPLLLPPQHDLPIPWDKVFSPRSSKFKFGDTIFPNLQTFYKNVKPLFWHLPPSARPWSLNYFAPSLTKHWHFLRWTRETTIWFIFFGHWIWTQAWPRQNEVTLKRKKLSHFCLFHREHVYVQ